MAQSEAHVMNVIQIHDETLFRNSRYNKVGLVEQVQNNNSQVIILQNAPESYSQQRLDVLLLLKADKSELINSYSKTEDDALIVLKSNVVDIVDSYSKTEDDALLLLKADKSHTYSKTEDDALLLLNAKVVDIVDSCSKSEDGALLLLKADETELFDSYSKIKDDAILLLKASVADLTNYVDLICAQTITGQKQFGAISVSSISKQKIGDNLYVVDKEVTDYWLDGTDLNALETELPDMSNVITTLGAATGGGNAITDKSIDGNVLTPVKNKNFIDTDYDQSISGQKTFNTTIHSVGIMVQTFIHKGDINNLLNNKADTQVSNTKGEDDALLLLKAYKTQLIDSCTKREINNLSNNKADAEVSYTKGDDDALLLLKADRTQLIYSYIKGKTNNLLNIKADTGVSNTNSEEDALLLLKADKSTTYSKSETYARDEVCSKIEDDALLLLKADKTQLIDSYIKGEINNLLINIADTGVSYTIGENDALLLLKAVKSTTYIKTQDDALLLLKADKSTTYSQCETYARGEVYTKIEDDVLLLLKADKTQLIDSYTKGVYYTDYESLKRATNDVYGNGKINIVDDWLVNSIIDGMKSMSWVQDAVQKQTEAIGDGVQPYDPNSDLQPRLAKFFPIKTSFTSFAGTIQINGNDTLDVVVNQVFQYYPMDLCDLSGSYLIDPQLQEQNQNNITSNGQPISHIDSIIMQHDILPPMHIPPSVFPQYTVTQVSRDQILALTYTLYDLDAFKIYIIDDTVNKLVMFNMHLRQKGFIDTK
ncbi:MAG: hypothetical protein EZS28_016319, partial [Streblomastix strix]